MDAPIFPGFTLTADGVWVSSQYEDIGYSDGKDVEKYLNDVFDNVDNLSCDSDELVSYIKDWSSEYHLSIDRPNVIKPFNFNKDSRVLEVGAGCGSITRYLAENYREVVSVEGSYARACLARKRCKDLNNVHIIVAPFQHVHFDDLFDLIVCIGVFEYAGSFVSGADPYDELMKYFHGMLNQDGKLFVAIENQYGLKYFSSSAEDHSGNMFEGIESYTRKGTNARTFGYNKLKEYVSRYFVNQRFYYPYPDYKLCRCIVSGELESDELDVAELLGGFYSRDYLKRRKELFSEEQALIDIVKNNFLHVFSNSFIVVGSKQDYQDDWFPCLGVIYKTNRKKEFRAVSKIVRQKNEVLVESEVTYPCDQKDELVAIQNYQVSWCQGETLDRNISLKLLDNRNHLEDIFEGATVWYSVLKKDADNGYVSGDKVDCIWKNCIVDVVGEGNSFFFDNEFVYSKRIKLKSLLIRAIYNHLVQREKYYDGHPRLKKMSPRKKISLISSVIGERLVWSDFNDFIGLEANFLHSVLGCSVRKQRMIIFSFIHLTMIYKIYLYLGDGLSIASSFGRRLINRMLK